MSELNRFINLIKKRELVVTLAFVIILSLLSYGKAFDFNFWRDDWAGIWLIKNNFSSYLVWAFQSRHPGNGILFFPYFLVGMNRFLWQVFGFVFKVFATFSVGLATYSLTKQKIAFIFSSLLYASYFGGLEAYTWASARLGPVLIILLSFIIYFYVSSYYEKSKKKLLTAYILLIAILFIEPSRAIFVPPVILLWETGTRFVERKLIRVGFLVRIGLIGVTTYIGLGLTKFGGSLAGNQNSYLKYLFERPDDLKNYFSSLGNLVISYFRNVRDLGGLLSGSEDLLAITGIILLIILITSGLILTFFRKKSGPLVVMFGVWIPLFYLPSWISEVDIVVGASHRYMAISSAGFVILISFLLLKVPKRYIYYIFLIIVCFNLVRSYQTVMRDYQIRAVEITQPLLDKQSSDVPPGETGGIFLVAGGNYLRGYVFDWSISGVIPFALAKNIKNEDLVPSGGISYEYAAKLICESNISRPLIYNWISQDRPIPIKNVYGWFVNDDGTIKNYTDETRIIVAQLSDCYKKDLHMNYTNGIILNSIIYLNDLFEIDKRVISLSWNSEEKSLDQLFVYLNVFDRGGDIIANKLFELKSLKGLFETSYIFNKHLGEPYKVQLKIKECNLDKCKWVSNNIKIDLSGLNNGR